jgi:hypothetical protein
MNRFVIGTLLASLFALTACGQGGPNVPSQGPEQVSTAAKAPGNAIALPSDTPIFAKLTAELDTQHCKAGDLVNTQITHDVKDGSRTAIKKGAVISGKISKVQAEPDGGGLYGVWIVFEQVELKSGESAELRLDIQAVAPPENGGADNLNGVDTGALMAGHGSATEGRVNVLTAKSRGTVGVPGVDVAFQNAGGAHITMLVSKKGNFRLVKGSQVVFRVFNP